MNAQHQSSVLVVDDDPMVRLVARETLGVRGFKVFEAENGHGAIALLQAHRPDAIILDVLMPVMDGFATCAALHAQPEWKHIPVLMMTGIDDIDAIETAYQVGATDFINKPINWTLLYHRLNYLLRASRVRNELRESEERYELVARAANDGLFDWDLSGNRVYFSPRWQTLLGFQPGEMGDSPEDWISRIHSDDSVRFLRDLSRHLAGETETFECDHRLLAANGSHRWFHTRGLALRDESGKAYRFAGSHTDISRRKAAEEQLLHDAFHDPLTGLPNRALFNDRVEHAIRTSQRRSAHMFAVLFLDLDRFKLINDSLGHESGDRLLVELGRRLQEVIRCNDTLARFGGDEFTLLLDDIESEKAAMDIVDRIQEALQRPFTLGEQLVGISASIGITFGAGRYVHAQDMLRDADTAMYQAKQRGRSGHLVFDSAMHSRAMSALHVETELRYALGRGEFCIYYQPIYCLTGRTIAGFEALLRWRHPQRGLLEASEFLSIAENCGLLVPIGRWVLQVACRQMRLLLQRHPEYEPSYMSVNLSSAEFAQSDLPDYLSKVMIDEGLAPAALRIEITEEILFENREIAEQVLERISRLGIRLSIDHFGRGHSSLSYLSRFPFELIKIDESLIGNLDHREESAQMIQAIVTFAHHLGMMVVATGSESLEEVGRLESLACEFGQGHALARPMSEDQLEALLAGVQEPDGLAAPGAGPAACVQ